MKPNARMGYATANPSSINIQVVEDEKTEADFEALLDKTKGIWTKGDGLEYQQKIREEWI